ncbi:hypothetical protein [Paenibacillus sp. 32O-W]|uniref:hypothetical protein n=1 Tax=Paenibacillus sp. 32O-W TaxID=1695218 RepID=UPI0011A5A2CC|nr:MULTISPECIES: hypothetical protein [Paenibacillaceae]
MDKRKTGIVLLIISCIFISSNLLAWAIAISGNQSYDLSNRMIYEFIGDKGINIGIGCLILGILYLVWAEIEYYRSGSR